MSDILFITDPWLDQTVTLTYPDNLATDVTEPITFTWEPVIDAIDYEIQIDIANTFDTGSLIYATTTSGLTEYSPGDLVDGETYYWRVRAKYAA